jgi:coenzyme F420-reducing hydrogenase delta subunit
MLPCVNCKKEVEPDQAKMFAEVLVCPDCYTIAERLYERGNIELRMMLTVLKEALRLTLIRGELQFLQQQTEENKSEEVMKRFAKMAKEIQAKSSGLGHPR